MVGGDGKVTTVGAGKYTYKLVQDWATLPRGETFGTVSAVATDSQDRVYVFQRGDPPMLVFDPEGSYLSSWSTGAFNRPHGICISDDIVYVTDSDDSVAMRLTLDGRPLQTLGTRGAHSDTGTEQYGDLVPRAAGPFNHPTKLAPAPWGDLYVSDGERNSRVHRFSSNGQLIASWGEPGKDGPDQFHMPHSVLVDRDSRIYVCGPGEQPHPGLLRRWPVRHHVDRPATTHRHRSRQRRRLLCQPVRLQCHAQVP